MFLTAWLAVGFVALMHYVVRTLSNGEKGNALVAVSALWFGPVYFTIGLIKSLRK